MLHLKENFVEGRCDPKNIPYHLLQVVGSKDRRKLTLLVKDWRPLSSGLFFTAVTMKDIAFWDMTTYGSSSKNRRFRGTYHLHLQGKETQSLQVQVFLLSRSVGQFVLVSGYHVGPATNFSCSPRTLSSGICGFSFSIGCPLWRDDRSVTYSYMYYWALPVLTVSFETRFPFCRILWLAGIR
jgi:hypothetical protein